MGEYLVFHDIAWHPAYAVYFFVIGISAAMYFFSALSWFRAEFVPLRSSAFYVSFGLLVVGGLMLIADLTQPLRFFHLFIPWYWVKTSPLMWGTIILGVYGLASVGYFLAMRKGDAKNSRLLAVIGSVAALGLPVYTGFDLTIHQARPVWNSPLMPVLFTALSLTSGAAVAAFLASGQEKLIGVLRQVMLWSTGAVAVMLLSLIVTTAYGGSGEELAYLYMTSGMGGVLFIGIGVLLGTIVPLVLLLAPMGRQELGIMAASVLLLAGGMALRYVILMSGQIAQTFFS